MQAMIHAPLLRNFYLSGRHARSQCTHSLAKPCLSCELVRFRCMSGLCACAVCTVEQMHKCKAQASILCWHCC